jgi:hypothetical protein
MLQSQVPYACSPRASTIPGTSRLLRRPLAVIIQSTSAAGDVGIAEFWPEDVMKVPAVGRKAEALPTTE